MNCGRNSFSIMNNMNNEEALTLRFSKVVSWLNSWSRRAHTLAPPTVRLIFPCFSQQCTVYGPDM